MVLAANNSTRANSEVSLRLRYHVRECAINICIALVGHVTGKSRASSLNSECSPTHFSFRAILTEYCPVVKYVGLEKGTITKDCKQAQVSSLKLKTITATEC